MVWDEIEVQTLGDTIMSSYFTKKDISMDEFKEKLLNIFLVNYGPVKKENLYSEQKTTEMGPVYLKPNSNIGVMFSYDASQQIGELVILPNARQQVK